MKTNFSIDNNYALVYQSQHFDLHNNYDFIGYNSNIDRKEFSLFWKVNSGEWVPGKLPKTLKVNIYGVHYLLVHFEDQNYPLTESKTLMDLTYNPSCDRTEHNLVINQPEPTSDDDIIFKFQDESLIRVKGEKLELLVE